MAMTTTHLTTAATETLPVRGFSEQDAPEIDLLRACVHCGMCLSSCPTYRITGKETSSPRGRLWLMNAVAEGRLDLQDDVFTGQMFECLDCRACEAVCPSGVQYGVLVEASRAQIVATAEVSRVRSSVRNLALTLPFQHLSAMRTMARFSTLYQRTGMQNMVRKSGLLRFLRIEDMELMMPPVAESPLLPGKETWGAHTAARQARLFNGCVMGSLFSGTNRAAGRVMARNDTRVDVPVNQGCCGALQVHAGLLETARDMARRNIDAFEAAGDGAIVVTAAGCGSTLKEYGHLLKHDPEYAARAKQFSERVRDVTEFLAERPLVTPGPLPRRVTYQDACHLAHAQRITAQPRTLLKAIPGLELVEMKESSLCCGSAGIYNLTHKEMAGELGARKCGNVMQAGAEEVVTANPGCALQMQTGLRKAGSTMKVRHIVDLLDEAYAAGDAEPIASTP